VRTSLHVYHMVRAEVNLDECNDPNCKRIPMFVVDSSVTSLYTVPQSLSIIRRRGFLTIMSISISISWTVDQDSEGEDDCPTTTTTWEVVCDSSTTEIVILTVLRGVGRVNTNKTGL